MLLESFDLKENYHRDRNNLTGQFWQMESTLRLKLRISQNRKQADKNCPEQFF